MQKIILALLTIFTLQPLAAMESDGSKRARRDGSNGFTEHPTIVPRPLEMPLAKELQPTGEELRIAIKENNQKHCQSLINRGVDVNSQDKLLNSPLILAAQLGHYNLCELLIKHGAQVDAQGFREVTALMNAAVNGHKEICELLIKDKAQVDAQSFDGETALMKAAVNGHKEICELLIDKGADVNKTLFVERLDQPISFLMNCLMAGSNIEICNLLVARGAQIRKNDLIFIADTEYAGSWIAPFEFMIPQYVDVNAQNEHGKTMLMGAANNCYSTKLLKWLIEQGADINAQDNEGKTALHYAAFECNAEICKILLEHGANPNALMNDGTPVLIHSLGGSLENHDCIYGCVKLLLEYGTDVNLLSDGNSIDYSQGAQNAGSTPLMEAMRWGSPEICELLLQYGADYEYQNNQTESAITRAQNIEDFDEDDESDEGAENNYMVNLLTNPKKMQQLMARRNHPLLMLDNRLLKKGLGDHSGLCNALLNREIGGMK